MDKNAKRKERYRDDSPCKEVVMNGMFVKSYIPNQRKGCNSVKCKVGTNAPRSVFAIEKNTQSDIKEQKEDECGTRKDNM